MKKLSLALAFLIFQTTFAGRAEGLRMSSGSASIAVSVLRTLAVREGRRRKSRQRDSQELIRDLNSRVGRALYRPAKMN